MGYGDGSIDEMCFDFFMFRAPLPETDDVGVCAGYRECYATCDRTDPFCPITCASRLGNACYACAHDAVRGECARLICEQSWDAFEDDRCEGDREACQGMEPPE